MAVAVRCSVQRCSVEQHHVDRVAGAYDLDVGRNDGVGIGGAEPSGPGASVGSLVHLVAEQGVRTGLDAVAMHAAAKATPSETPRLFSTMSLWNRF